MSSGEGDVRINSRIESDGYYATVRYIGAVPPTTGLWYGVEWDDPTRGKHDGSQNGVRYFKTRHVKSGSFIRPVKCRIGVSFMQAALRRYGCSTDENEDDSRDMFVIGGNKQTPVVLIGAEQINKRTSQLALLQQLSLQETLINRPDGEMCSLPHCRQLDISFNLLTTWNDVLAIIAFMPKLEELNVSSNRLELSHRMKQTVAPLTEGERKGMRSEGEEGVSSGMVPSRNGGEVGGDVSIHLPREHSGTTFTSSSSSINSYSLPRSSGSPIISPRSSAPSGLKTLYLNRMDYSWTDIASVLHMFTHVERLHACYNLVKSIDCSDMIQLDHIALVNLEGNSIGDWGEVIKLSQLSNLSTLILNRTDIDDVRFPDGASVQEPTKYFRALRALFLDNNRISSWSSINELNRLEALTSLRLSNNPLVNGMEVSSAHQMVLARIGNLKHYNSTVVTASERRGAEIDYLRIYGKEWKMAGGGKINTVGGSGEMIALAVEQFTRSHPRYELLVTKHGAAEDSEITTQSSALKNSLLTVTIDTPLLPSRAPVTRKIPPTISVQKVKMLVQRLYSVETSRHIRLTYSSHKLVAHSPEINLDSDLREIGYYSVENNDIIHAYW